MANRAAKIKPVLSGCVILVSKPVITHHPFLRGFLCPGSTEGLARPFKTSPASARAAFLPAALNRTPRRGIVYSIRGIIVTILRYIKIMFCN
jgi:hypothetical protein